MQTLSDASDKKGGDAFVKKDPSRQKKEACSLSEVTGEVTTLKIFLVAGGRSHASVFRRHIS